MGVVFRKAAWAAMIVVLASVATVEAVVIVSLIAGRLLLDARFLPLYLCVFGLAAAWCNRDLKRQEAKLKAGIDGRESLRRVIGGIFAHDRRAQAPLLRTVALMPEEDARRVLAWLAIGLMERPEIESALRRAHEIQDIEEETK